MYINFDFASRLSQLRMQKGVSARDMSLSIGQNETYINKIENRKALPSMECFFYICEYLEVTPAQFFDETITNPRKLQRLLSFSKRLSDTEIDHVINIVEDITQNEKPG